MYDYKSIKHVHLEISTKCNAACPLCPRNFFGVDVIDDYPLVDMSLEQAKQIFTYNFLNQLQRIDINGNLGDFVTAKDGLEIVKYFRNLNKNLHIEISTNASAKPQIWEELAKLNICVTFDLDGLEDTHKLYRQNTNWNLIIKNAKKFINAGGYATWKMIKFDHNNHQVEECRKLSEILGFKKFDYVDHGRSNGPVFNKNKELSHTLGNPTQSLDFNIAYQLQKNHRERVVTSPLDFYKIKTKISNNITCKMKEMQSIYITAHGQVYPCCWTGFYPDQMFHEGNEQIVKIKGNNNALEVGIEKAMDWFVPLQETWTKKSYEEGSLFICNSVCGN